MSFIAPLIASARDDRLLQKKIHQFWMEGYFNWDVAISSLI